MLRVQAVNSLQKILQNKEFFEEHKDHSFVNMLVLTTLRHLVFIKHVLKQHMKKKPKSAYVEYALFAAIAETLYMDSPDYAIINSYVELIKTKTDKYVAGFANAILRNITAQKAEIQALDKGEFFTSEFFKILKPDYSKSTIAKIQKSASLEPATDLTIKTDSNGWAQKLNAKVLDDHSIRLPFGVKIPSLPGFAEGDWWVQDFAASLAVKTLANIEAKTALDLCAAPGGKTAQLIQKGAITTALDSSSTRLKKLEENLARLHLNAHQIICADGIEYLKNAPPQFDIVLLDAPCSATGTLRRHPEVVHIKTLQDVINQAQVQKQFLEHISNALKPGGTLVYSVCSISHLEGEKQIEDFLANHPTFVLEESIRTLPHQDMDSFYIARLRKIT